MRRIAFTTIIALGLAVAPTPVPAQMPQNPEHEVARLVAAMLGPTPLVEDLRELSDGIGGRATGSPANLRAVEWGLAKFREAGVPAARESFQMPLLWLENSATALVWGDDVEFAPRVAAMPFSARAAGATAPLVDAGMGAAADFARLGNRARGAFVLVETEELLDIEGLFREYNEAAGIEARAVEAGVAGVVYVGSRAPGVLYRHNASAAVHGPDARPMLVMERAAGLRTLRLLRHGATLSLTITLDLQTGPAYPSYNVVGEIRGATRPEEVVVIGAHLDAWDLGGGALDNGANVALVIDVAREMQRLGIRPARTVRFALWNGEEQGMVGSWRYTQTHAAELDGHVMAASFDIGCGKITGFFTNGREELLPAVDRALTPVAGLGPFANINAPIVGTDNFDFMLEGVANLVANQEPATYGPNYHAATDQFGQCDPLQLRLNAAIAAALTYGFANGEAGWGRQTREEVERLVQSTDLGDQMRSFGLWDAWERGVRGRRR